MLVAPHLTRTPQVEHKMHCLTLFSVIYRGSPRSSQPHERMSIISVHDWIRQSSHAPAAPLAAAVGTTVAELRTMQLLLQARLREALFARDVLAARADALGGALASRKAECTRTHAALRERKRMCEELEAQLRHAAARVSGGDGDDEAAAVTAARLRALLHDREAELSLVRARAEAAERTCAELEASRYAGGGGGEAPGGEARRYREKLREKVTRIIELEEAVRARDARDGAREVALEAACDRAAAAEREAATLRAGAAGGGAAAELAARCDEQAREIELLRAALPFYGGAPAAALVDDVGSPPTPDESAEAFRVRTLEQLLAVAVLQKTDAEAERESMKALYVATMARLGEAEFARERAEAACRASERRTARLEASQFLLAQRATHLEVQLSMLGSAAPAKAP